jgi:flavin reductase (DIM6/NTAB) family NADH-FMN oxidoreductase RutF
LKGVYVDMANKLAYEEYSQQFLKQLPKGAFLTVKDGDRLNTMTIGWGSIGWIWQKPILMVMVRYSRHTYELIDKAQPSLINESTAEIFAT